MDDALAHKRYPSMICDSRVALRSARWFWQSDYAIDRLRDDFKWNDKDSGGNGLGGYSKVHAGYNRPSCQFFVLPVKVSKMAAQCHPMLKNRKVSIITNLTHARAGTLWYTQKSSVIRP